jgi:hypothetical protein
VERNNCEFRVYAGFDADITTSEISLAAAEGWAVAGLCNMKACNHDIWTLKSDEHVVTAKPRAECDE